MVKLSMNIKDGFTSTKRRCAALLLPGFLHCRRRRPRRAGYPKTPAASSRTSVTHARVFACVRAAPASLHLRTHMGHTVVARKHAGADAAAAAARSHAHQHQLRNLSVRWEINDVTRDGRRAGGRSSGRRRRCITLESKCACGYTCTADYGACIKNEFQRDYVFSLRVRRARIFAVLCVCMRICSQRIPNCARD